MEEGQFVAFATEIGGSSTSGKNNPANLNRVTRDRQAHARDFYRHFRNVCIMKLSHFSKGPPLRGGFANQKLGQRARWLRSASVRLKSEPQRGSAVKAVYPLEH